DWILTRKRSSLHERGRESNTVAVVGEHAHDRPDRLSVLSVVEHPGETAGARSARVRMRCVPPKLACRATQASGANRRVSDQGRPRETSRRRKGVSAHECVILVGLPGAGKSTFVRSRFPDHTHVSKDTLPRHARDKQARQDAAIRTSLSAGRPVVVDNTNVT